MPAIRSASLRLPLVLAGALALAACAELANVPRPTEADFATIQPGMTSQQILTRFGRPTWVFGVRQENLTIWNYRYNRNDCVIYQVSIRPDGTVRDAAPGYDPACDGPSGRD
jgi:outer membrane protein assembly factor BamE (lipoprotein component of BamABCDE complex)